MAGTAKSLITVLHLCADARRAKFLRRFADDHDVDAVIPFGDVTGPVLTDGEQVLYRQAQELFQDAHSLKERVEIARAYLAHAGVADGYRDAVRFYLSHIVDLEMDDRVVWKEAYLRARERVARMVGIFGPRRCAPLADTLVCEDVLKEDLLDYRVLKLGNLVVKGVGLSPRDQILVPVKYTPSEYRHELPGAVPLADYVKDFDIFVANALTRTLQAPLRRLKWRLVVIPGAVTDVAAHGNVTLAFESPGTFSLFKWQPERTTRQVYRFVGSDARLFRTDTFDRHFGVTGFQGALDRPLKEKR